VSNQIEAGRHAQECRRAFTREPSKEARADAKREATRCSARCQAHNRWAFARMGARRVPSSSRAGPNQRPGAAVWSVAHWHAREVQMWLSGWSRRQGAGADRRAILVLPAVARKAASTSKEMVAWRLKPPRSKGRVS
jgi:hypothetical protein